MKPPAGCLPSKAGGPLRAKLCRIRTRCLPKGRGCPPQKQPACCLLSMPGCRLVTLSWRLFRQACHPATQAFYFQKEQRRLPCLSLHRLTRCLAAELGYCPVGQACCLVQRRGHPLRRRASFSPQLPHLISPGLPLSCRLLGQAAACLLRTQDSSYLAQGACSPPQRRGCPPPVQLACFVLLAMARVV